MNQTVKEIIHPVPTQANRAIEGPPESIPDSQSDNEDWKIVPNKHKVVQSSSYQKILYFPGVDG